MQRLLKRLSFGLLLGAVSRVRLRPTGLTWQEVRDKFQGDQPHTSGGTNRHRRVSRTGNHCLFAP